MTFLTFLELHLDRDLLTCADMSRIAVGFSTRSLLCTFEDLFSLVLLLCPLNLCNLPSSHPPFHTSSPLHYNVAPLISQSKPFHKVCNAHIPDAMRRFTDAVRSSNNMTSNTKEDLELISSLQ